MRVAEKLTHINSLKGKIDELMPQKDWDDAFFRKIKIDFTYSTNKLEGSTLTYGQTIKLLKDFVTPKDATTGEVLDMINHQAILDNIFSNYRSQNLSEENIKELHRQLMKDTAQWSDDGLYSPGQYKSFENMTIRPTGKIHTYIPPDQVAVAMEELIRATNNLLGDIDVNNTQKHPLTTATWFHQQFLNFIHPFSDVTAGLAESFPI
jgi:Fic family protein